MALPPPPPPASLPPPPAPASLPRPPVAPHRVAALPTGKTGLAALLKGNRNQDEQLQLPPPNYLGSIWIWGCGGYYRLSQGDTEHRGIPVQIKVREDDLNFVEVTCGAAHLLGRTKEGKVYSWGKCHVGQLGHGQEDVDEKHPRLIEALKDIKISSISCGTSHIACLAENGDVYTNGVPYFGTLGHGDEKIQSTPKLVEALKGKKVTRVAAGDFHTTFLIEDGSVYACGKNEFGQLGMNSVKLYKIPQQISPLPPIQKIFSGDNNTFAISVSGEIWVWGENNLGQLGLGHQNHVFVPTKLPNLTFSPVEISSSSFTTYALTGSGELYCWGQAIYLGLSYSVDKVEEVITRPIEHPFFVNKRVQFISAGSYHSAAFTSDGLLYTWGEATYGKLGDGNIVPVPNIYHPIIQGFVNSPQLIQLPPATYGKVRGLAAGSNHTLLALN